jgi:hypothetical protein
MVSSVPTVFPAFNASEWAADGGFYQVGVPGLVQGMLTWENRPSIAPFCSRIRCEAEGGGIVWEFLLLRGGGAFASQS